jgi:hypothetical protein
MYPAQASLNSLGYLGRDGGKAAAVTVSPSG